MENYIAQVRKKKKLKQGELAERVGISIWYMNKIENDKQDGMIRVWVRIANELNVKLDKILPMIGENDKLKGEKI